MKPLFFFIALFFLGNVNAANYYFSSSSGDDNRTIAQAQNPATPWKTLSKLNSFFSNLQPGDSVLFKRGDTFYGSITVAKSGEPNKPIVLTAYGTGEKPVISGFTTLSSWTSVGGGIYQSPCPSCKPTVNMLTMDGVSKALGRYPNTGYLTYESFSGTTSITDNELSATPNWTGAEVVMRKIRWLIERNKITNHAGNTITYTSSYDFPGQRNYGYFITNDPKTLDTLGEWYFESVSKKMQLYFGKVLPSSFSVQTSIIDTLIYTGWKSYLVFDNLSLQGANVTAFQITRSNHIAIQDCSINFSGRIAIECDFSTDLVIDGSNINNTNDIAIRLNTNCNYITIRNNTIKNTSLIPGMGVTDDETSMAIHANCSNVLMEYNTIDSSGYHGISFKTGDSITVKNNFVNHSCLIKDDGAGIYVYSGILNAAPINRKIIGNIVMNSEGTYAGTAENTTMAHGIYLDGYTQNVEVLSNTVANCSNNGILLNSARGIRAQKNTFFNNETQFSISNLGGVRVNGADIKNNIMFSKSPIQPAFTFYAINNNELQSFGVADSNYYARPFNDEYVFYSFEEAPPSNQQYYNLKEWSTTLRKDLHSKKSPLLLPAYTYNLKSGNKFSNETFTSGFNGINWSNSTVYYDNKLDGVSLKVTPNDEGQLNFNIGAVDSSKDYIMKFQSLGLKHNAKLKINIRMAHPPYTVLANEQYLPLTDSVLEQQVLIRPILKDNNVQLRFLFDAEDSTFWIDNVKFYEADITMTNPEDHIRFEYNASITDKVIPLNGVYMGVDSTIYSNTVILTPYSSLVLLKDVSYQTLPLQFINFEGKRVDKEINLTWKTTNEVNTNFFEVLRSKDGLHFQTIERLPSNNKPSISTYTLIDNKPFTGKNYYQIKQVDKDGKYTYSKIINVYYSDALSIQISPNPATDKLTISINTVQHARKATLQIRTVAGSIIKNMPVSFFSENIPIDVSTLAKGAYIVSLLYDNTTLNQKFIKQ